MKPKKIFIYCCPLIFTIASYGQNYNPYKLIKKKAKVVTAYGNKFTEVFDMSGVQRMGSVLINIHTRKIVKMLNADSLAKKAADNSISGRWYSIDPLAETQVSWSPYHFVYNNPIKFVDPNGLEGMNFDISSSGDNNKNKNFDFLSPKGKETFEDHGKISPNGLDGMQYITSTDVKKNKDGSYTVVGANNDGDNNIYVQGADGKRTSEIIGQTINPWDFMYTDDKDGTFSGPTNGITFSLDNLPNGNRKVSLLATWWALTTASLHSTEKSLAMLAWLSRTKGYLDIKDDYSDKYTAVSYGSKITTARTIGNILFGKNMRAINRFTPTQLFVPATAFYMSTMPVVGAYNQQQNNGNGYNRGWPFYGEHTYSGTGIYLGYFGKKP